MGFSFRLGIKTKCTQRAINRRDFVHPPINTLSCNSIFLYNQLTHWLPLWWHFEIYDHNCSFLSIGVKHRQFSIQIVENPLHLCPNQLFAGADAYRLIFWHRCEFENQYQFHRKKWISSPNIDQTTVQLTINCGLEFIRQSSAWLIIRLRISNSQSTPGKDRFPN